MDSIGKESATSKCNNCQKLGECAYMCNLCWTAVWEAYYFSLIENDNLEKFLDRRNEALIFRQIEEEFLQVTPLLYDARKESYRQILDILRQVENQKMNLNFEDNMNLGSKENIMEERQQPFLYGVKNLLGLPEEVFGSTPARITDELLDEVVRFLASLDKYKNNSETASRTIHAATKRASLDLSQKLTEWRKRPPYVELENSHGYK